MKASFKPSIKKILMMILFLLISCRVNRFLEVNIRFLTLHQHPPFFKIVISCVPILTIYQCLVPVCTCDLWPSGGFSVGCWQGYKPVNPRSNPNTQPAAAGEKKNLCEFVCVLFALVVLLSSCMLPKQESCPIFPACECIPCPLNRWHVFS